MTPAWQLSLLFPALVPGLRWPPTSGWCNFAGGVFPGTAVQDVTGDCAEDFAGMQLVFTLRVDAFPTGGDSYIVEARPTDARKGTFEVVLRNERLEWVTHTDESTTLNVTSPTLRIGDVNRFYLFSYDPWPDTWTAFMYMNGALVGEEPSTAWFMAPPGRTLVLGGSLRFGVESDHFNGLIEDVWMGGTSSAGDKRRWEDFLAPACALENATFHGLVQGAYDMSQACSDLKGGGFGVAWTAKINELGPSDVPMIQFGTAFTVTLLSVGRLAVQYQNSAGLFTLSSPQVASGSTHRFLLSLNASGGMQFFMDSGLIGEVDAEVPLASEARAVFIGGDGNGGGSIKGSLEKVWFFDETIDWAYAEVAECSFRGRTFNLSDPRFDLAPFCTGKMFGFVLSIFLTLKWDVLDPYVMFFEWGSHSEFGSIQVILADDGSWLFSYYPETAYNIDIKTRPVSEAEMHRYLLTIDVDVMTVYEDGIMLDSKSLPEPFPIWPPRIGMSDAESWNRFRGRVEDVLIFSNITAWSFLESPVCTYGGKEFNGQDGSEVDITSTCTDTLISSAFSVAFTARVDDFSRRSTVLELWPKKDSYGQYDLDEQEHTLMVEVDPTNQRLEFFHRPACGCAYSVYGPSVPLGSQHRYLAIVDAFGTYYLYMDGILHDQHNYSEPLKQKERTVVIGGETWSQNSGLTFTGLVEDVLIFNEKVSWEGTVVTTSTTSTTSLSASTATGSTSGTSTSTATVSTTISSSSSSTSSTTGSTSRTSTSTATVTTASVTTTVTITFTATMTTSMTATVTTNMAVDTTPLDVTRSSMATTATSVAAVSALSTTSMDTTAMVTNSMDMETTSVVFMPMSSTGASGSTTSTAPVMSVLSTTLSEQAVSRLTDAMSLSPESGGRSELAGTSTLPAQLAAVRVSHSSSLAYASTSRAALANVESTGRTTTPGTSDATSASDITTAPSTHIEGAATSSTSLPLDAVIVTVQIGGATGSSHAPFIIGAVQTGIAAVTRSRQLPPSVLHTTLVAGSTGLHAESVTELRADAASLAAALRAAKAELADAIRQDLPSSALSIEGVAVYLASQAGSRHSGSEKAVLANAEEEASGLLAELARSNETSLARDVAGATMLAAKLSPSTLSIVVPLARDAVPEVQVTVPESVVAAFAEEAGEDLAMVVTVPGNLSSMGAGGVEVEAALVIEVLGLSGRQLNTSKLKEPIDFTLPTTFSQGLVCAFFDEQRRRWSTGGVTTTSNVLGNPMRCRTWHLSLFGAIVQGFLQSILCSNFRLFDEHSLKELLSSDWHDSPGAILFWLLLAIVTVTWLAAVFVDHRRAQQYRWSNEFFLFPSGDPEEEEMEEEGQDIATYLAEQGARKHSVTCCLTGYLISCCESTTTCCKESALRDALDEIVSSYVEFFSELRSVAEGIWDGLEITALGAGRVFTVSRAVMAQLVLKSSQRLVSSSMLLTPDVVKFVLEDKDFSAMLLERAHLSRRSARVSSIGRASTASDPAPLDSEGFVRGSVVPAKETAWFAIGNREEGWAALHAEVCEHMRSTVALQTFSTLPCMVWRIFLQHNPFGEIFARDVFKSCKLRCLFFSMQLLGDLLVVCIFFAASGSVKGKPSQGGGSDDCVDEELSEEMSYKMGRILAIAMGSVLLAGLPVSLLRSFHIRRFKKFPSEACAAWTRQLQAWRFQELVVWLLGAFYLCFSLFFVALFLANIAPDDHEDWTQTGAMSLAQEVLILPLGVALFMPTLAAALLSAVSVAGRTDRNTLLQDVRGTVSGRSAQPSFDI